MSCGAVVEPIMDQRSCGEMKKDEADMGLLHILKEAVLGLQALEIGATAIGPATRIMPQFSLEAKRFPLSLDRRKCRWNENVGLLGRERVAAAGRRPNAVFDRPASHAVAFVEALVRPDVHPTRALAGDRIHAGQQRGAFKPLGQCLLPALDGAGQNAGLEEIISNLEERPMRAGLWRRQERQQDVGVAGGGYDKLGGAEWIIALGIGFAGFRGLAVGFVFANDHDLVERADIRVPAG